MQAPIVNNCAKTKKILNLSTENLFKLFEIDRKWAVSIGCSSNDYFSDTYQREQLLMKLPKIENSWRFGSKKSPKSEGELTSKVKSGS